ncbi:DUF397 domain-containing protein [Streptomyces sp. NBC_00893]|nr:DUF397 domain-containing protein [Streptomyces sp. NBC_00893]
MSELKWFKSSFSEASGNNCIEVAIAEPNGIVLRESEIPAAVISTNRVALRALILGVKTSGAGSGHL